MLRPEHQLTFKSQEYQNTETSLLRSSENKLFLTKEISSKQNSLRTLHMINKEWAQLVVLIIKLDAKTVSVM